MSSTMSSTATMPDSRAIGHELRWYQDAIIYQVHIRSFFDSNQDGIGDLRGLIARLDYIQNLNVSAIWLLPFFPSPLRDGGYDISDYTNVNSTYGTLRDFKLLLQQAHQRDLKVISELVINHTSDEHPWFQRSRRAKPGSKWRNFYVWSDTDQAYSDARIIFKDFEASNWSWDPEARAYYWHRFYHHQPDLNFDNPEVRDAILDVLDFWFDLGVDGLRLDAVPYLFEREGTNCENLPETHAFLKEIRRHVDEKHQDKMLLAEANQWPEDAAAYFGDGDECHMNFHFPLMPRLFMSVEREENFPVIDILDQTPKLPDGCQWAIFLRNHDELTLEMVTEEERDHMYRKYAADPRSRINLGIRRRLAPLLGNNRRKIELMNSLLFSLPGTPIIYYGDEIAMGDNIFLGDRDGVRTPMQWSDSRNADFSRANPQKLFLPVITDPQYHYEKRNVESEHNDPSSLLWWMRRVIALRRQYRVFGRGTMEVLPTANGRVIAFLRRYEEEVLLIVANLSRHSQCVELDLSNYDGSQVIELFGQSEFPSIGERPYTITLNPHGFYWFSLPATEAKSEEFSLFQLPALQVEDGWESLFTGEAENIVEHTLKSFLKRHRWFGGKARHIHSVEILDHFELSAGAPPRDLPDSRSAAESSQPLCLLIVRVNYSEGESDVYSLVLAMATEAEADEIFSHRADTALLRTISPAGASDRLVYEATWDKPFWKNLVHQIRRRKRLKSNGSRILIHKERDLLEEADAESRPNQIKVFAGQQSNSSAVVEDRFILKLYRRLQEGVNPDVEMANFIHRHTSFAHVPRVVAELEYRGSHLPAMTLGVVQQFIPNEGDAWDYSLRELERFLERVQTLHESDYHQAPEEIFLRPEADDGSGNATVRSAVKASAMQLGSRPLEETTFPPVAYELMQTYLPPVKLLGQRTAEMHRALSGPTSDMAFAPESFTMLYQRSIFQSLRTQLYQSLALLQKRLADLPPEAVELGEQVLRQRTRINDLFYELTRAPIAARRIRCHGDFHLGQVLYTGKDFVIIDFEGEPNRPVSERRIKRSPFRDVAGMLRSFHYAAQTALRRQSAHVVHLSEPAMATEEWLALWCQWASAAFLQSYLEGMAETGVLPKSKAQREMLLKAFVLEKALYELGYELNNRPDWVSIPLQGIMSSLNY